MVEVELKLNPYEVGILSALLARHRDEYKDNEFYLETYKVLMNKLNKIASNFYSGEIN